MLLSQAMLKSAPEMTTKKGHHQQQQSSLQSEPNGGPATRQRSASLFLTNNTVPAHPRSQSIVQFEKTNESLKHGVERSVSQPVATKMPSNRRPSQTSPPPVSPTSTTTFDPSRRNSGDKEKKTLRQMFQRMTTKGEAAASQSGSFQVEVSWLCNLRIQYTQNNRLYNTYHLLAYIRLFSIKLTLSSFTYV